MNNAQLPENPLEEEVKTDIRPLLREKITKLTEIIEALSNISQSSYWNVLRENEFDSDLHTLISRLEKEKDTIEIYRLQGRIEQARRYELVDLLQARRAELERIKDKLNANY